MHDGLDASPVVRDFCSMLASYFMLACKMQKYNASSAGYSGGGGTPCNGLYGAAPPERGALFRLGVYKRVGIS